MLAFILLCKFKLATTSDAKKVIGTFVFILATKQQTIPSKAVQVQKYVMR